ncbi:MAG: Re/Si-specific NAD(P)(+) transhydrogenase subunit alpha [Bacteroidales bacterium]|nr:Re/Si-specific NAD(P)(+) transhydrogenase subunit alpha [Bacteroidales bacterium]
MKIGVLKEQLPEKRVALTPEGVKSLKSLQCDILVENNAGASAYYTDRQYQEAGGMPVSRHEVLTGSDMILMIQPLADNLLEQIAPACIMIGCFNPYQNEVFLKKLQQREVTSFSMELVPRTTLAQAMDILSSMATVAGYKAVLEAASSFPRFFPMFMSAAGTIKPARMLILGAGVAGLQALAVGRRLGAVVEVFDVRSAVKEEVMSLGGKFIEVEGAKEDAAAGGYAVEQTEEFLKKQGELIHNHAVKSDVIIATAQIPGKKAPVLIKKETVNAMNPGSVIIDLAASTGGNCEYTENDKSIVVNGITVIGKSDYPSDMPADASRMYNNNMINFLKLLINQGGQLNLDFTDEIVKGTCLTHKGEIMNERIRSIVTSNK